MAEEEASWDQSLEEWLITEGYCYAAGMAQLDDGAFYAAAPQEAEVGPFSAMDFFYYFCSSPMALLYHMMLESA